MEVHKVLSESLPIPTETLKSLERVAADRHMPLKRLLKFYIGRSLRQGLTQEFVKKHQRVSE